MSCVLDFNVVEFLYFFVLKTACMSVVSCFECIFRKSDVCLVLIVVLYGDCCLVDYAWGEASSPDWALIWVSAVAVWVVFLCGGICPGTVVESFCCVLKSRVSCRACSCS